jgi:hypothetical protein
MPLLSTHPRTERTTPDISLRAQISIRTRKDSIPFASNYETEDQYSVALQNYSSNGSWPPWHRPSATELLVFLSTQACLEI